jgi:signal transduction histidine kinase
VNGELLSRDVRRPALAVLALCVLVGALTRQPAAPALSVSGAVLALGAGVLLAGRGPRAALALAAAAAAGVALVAGDRANDVGWFGLCVLVFWSVLATGPRLGGAFWLGSVVLLTVQLVTAETDLGWLPWIAGVTVSGGAAILLAHERALLTQLREAQDGLAERSRAEERNRIARELHDVIAHSLTVSLLHVESARLALEHDPGDAARTLAEAERLGRESLDEVRTIMGMLRTDSDRGATSPVPGIDAFPALVERFQAAGAAVTLTLDGDLDRVRATSGATLYRILQEALTNATKHAPGSAVAVRVNASRSRVELSVDSAGAPGSGSGMGLITMRERAEAVGGSCQAGPGGPGWRVLATVPLTPVGVAAPRAG